LRGLGGFALGGVCGGWGVFACPACLPDTPNTAPYGYMLQGSHERLTDGRNKTPLTVKADGESACAPSPAGHGEKAQAQATVRQPDEQRRAA